MKRYMIQISALAAVLVFALFFYHQQNVFASWNTISSLDAEVIVQGGNGFGSTNTIVRRFSNVIVNTGAAVTYTDDPVYGASFLINYPGVYAISYTDQRTDNAYPGFLYYIDIDTAPPASNVSTILASTTWSSVATSSPTMIGKNNITMLLDAGDVIRPWWFGNGSGGTYADGFSQFDIVKVR